MAFKFGLEPVLKHRKRIEEMAQREFAEAQSAVDECLSNIEKMYQRMDEVRAEILHAQNQGTSTKINEICEMEQFLKGHKIRVEAMRLKARELLQIAEQKQEALLEAAKEKKVLAKLREKKFFEYQEWLRKIEAKALDDITMMRHGWGKNE